jgi:hypothetical protein
VLFKLNTTKAQTFENFFGVDSNQIHFKYWLLKNCYSFDSVIKYHSITFREDLKAFENSLAINVCLVGSNNLTVEVNKELMVSIKNVKHKLIVNERGTFYEFKYRKKKIKWIRVLYQDNVNKVRFRDGKTLAISREFEKKNVSEEFLNQMEQKFNFYFIDIKV